MRAFHACRAASSPATQISGPRTGRARMKSLELFAAIPALIAMALAPACALSQSYPSRPVRIIVPFPPGGGLDSLTRALGAELSARWKQPVIVENKPGAGSLIGVQDVSRSPADGYTLLATVNQTFVTARYLYKNLPYEPDKDFAPITMMGKSAQLVIASQSFPANTLKQAIELVRDGRKNVAYGSYGVGSQPQLLFELVKKRTGVDIIHTPYKGVAPMLAALAGGEIALGTASYGVAAPLMAAGKIKAIAAASSERIPELPNVSTTREQGMPYARAEIWMALFAPAGVPSPIIGMIGDDVRSILRTPDFAAKYMTPQGLSVVASDADSLREDIAREVQEQAEMIKAANIVPE